MLEKQTIRKNLVYMYKLRTPIWEATQPRVCCCLVEKCNTRMAGTLFRLFVILLGLSHLVCLKAVPVTRTENLMQGQVHLTLENNHKVITERNLHWEEPTITERMELELHDYSPSGPNGRHTPRAP
ncbi:hypothetical protein JHK82_011613 [Glycine max]|uniref:Uncharacterized protein n=2 Tax=Glycine subgen. Soja TaxID=1462606 RepID=K7KMI8_SOYBN|nr:uncharacterized protein LOC100819493 [Glycine max]XP_028231378.1 uncharacterized protein LOC114411853 [Glycine soja]KAG5027980.1 hypothetical protein JHK87_011494 [Glycine soja]KAG5056605.1 hypothetical protein JHK86_011601 [Glycine max]KAG5153644.1 hypothetical protein JHK82_011613 [Glycine max]KAH1132492.1 hypothetical protein GYH30_011371 [Glycine max]KAH1248651.1 hypothetical protein GmHk_05G012208 [Glycine max]|eukprot:XP_003524765.3 uncharacterized protein LOC100819493 [Glycine max]